MQVYVNAWSGKAIFASCARERALTHRPLSSSALQQACSLRTQSGLRHVRECQQPQDQGCVHAQNKHLGMRV
eukprot:3944142-Prymnesium_polylepis.1